VRWPVTRERGRPLSLEKHKPARTTAAVLCEEDASDNCDRVKSFHRRTAMTRSDHVPQSVWVLVLRVGMRASLEPDGIGPSNGASHRRLTIATDGQGFGGAGYCPPEAEVRTVGLMRNVPDASVLRRGRFAYRSWVYWHA
jgi:hypothetical protein